MARALCALSVILSLIAVTFSESASPEYMDMLLMTKNYEKFAEITGLSVDLVKPGPGTSSNPMFNKGLLEGDIVPREKDQERQNIRFEKYPGNKWPGIVPYVISNSFFFNRRRVQAGIDEWNAQFKDCIKWVPRNGENDYVLIFPGNGCYSYLGKTGGQQMLSLQMPGCLSLGTVVHEMEHAAGFTHEHNREDRDTYVEVLRENIPPQWQSQYDKNDPEKFGITSNYDYYSVMHYPLEAPDSDGRPAFRILMEGIDESQLGQRQGFTDTDIIKVKSQYCTNSTRR